MYTTYLPSRMRQASKQTKMISRICTTYLIELLAQPVSEHTVHTFSLNRESEGVPKIEAQTRYTGCTINSKLKWNCREILCLLLI